MKFLIQRVTSATVEVDSQEFSAIQQGLCVFVGIAASDCQTIMNVMLDKLLKIRIFPNEQGLLDRSLLDIKGDLLWVSQFTLMADCKKGRRPFFGSAAQADKAQQLYQAGFELAQQYALGTLARGKFGADMQIRLVNDGPVTLLLDSEELGISAASLLP